MSQVTIDDMAPIVIHTGTWRAGGSPKEFNNTVSSTNTPGTRPSRQSAPGKLTISWLISRNAVTDIYRFVRLLSLTKFILDLTRPSAFAGTSIAVYGTIDSLSARAISTYALDGATPISVVAGSATTDTYNQQLCVRLSFVSNFSHTKVTSSPDSWDSGPISDGQQ
jgi:hypothetical protein